jgi:molybdate transport system ATP-binding protein
MTMLSVRLQLTLGAMGQDVDLPNVEGVLAVVGPNGAGKSTLLRAILGAHPLTNGRIALGTEVWADTTQHTHVPIEQRRVGYMPQNHALFPHMSVRAHIAFAISLCTSTHANVDDVLTRFSLNMLAQRKPAQLSGGEQQRVALARAFAGQPRALLLDEPLASLDVHTRGEMRALMRSYIADAAVPTILTTHDADDARLLAARIAVLESGRVTQIGSWEDLVAAPATAFVRAFVAVRDSSA